MKGEKRGLTVVSRNNIDKMFSFELLQSFSSFT